MIFQQLVSEPGTWLRYLATNDLLSACEPMPVDRFVKYCTDRGLDVTAKRLESLERLGVFFPLVRIQYPRIKIKLERVGQNQFRRHGMLNEGEQWDGELREENSRLSWRSEWITSWIEEGFAWDPRTRPFVPWATFIHDGYDVRIQTFYSMFQCYSLQNVLTILTCRTYLEEFGEKPEDAYREGSDPHRVGQQLREAGEQIVAALREYRRGEDAAVLSQVLSARYYFHTQGDHRTISVPPPDFDGWDWWELSRTWDATKVAADIGLTPETVAEIHSDVEFLTSSDDPLEHWYELVSFVALGRREKLKGDALFAQLGYSMEQMLRLFYRDLTGETLLRPDESPGWLRTDRYGEDVTENPLRYLEFLVNEYNLNPRPKAILVVEGEGEVAETPRLAAQLLGSNFAVAGIEVRPLGSVDEFTGDKRLDAYGALEKLIDDYHARQTIVFIVLDNENRARVVRDRLIKARSRLVPKRMLTKPEYVHLWNRTFEFDNFSDAEIAAAMSKVAGERYSFTESEIADCRAKWDKQKKDYLSLLYEETLQYGLNKRALMKTLVDGVIANRHVEVDSATMRPIVKILNRLIDFALVNHQPESQEGWLINQKTGYFGDYDAE